MTERVALELDFSIKSLLIAAVLTTFAIPTAFGQTNAPLQSPPPTAAYSSAAITDKLEFEVASVRQNKSDDEQTMNVSPTLGDGPVSPGGLYLARNIKLIQYIAFAYKLTQVQLQSVVSQVPWSAEDRFDIEARAEGNPTKDQYRLMMQSLLAERFHLAVHYETRVTPLYALIQVKPGKLGPQLRLHRPDDPVCTTPAAQLASGSGGLPPYKVDAEGFPETCGGPLRMTPSSPGRIKSGGRDVPMARFAAIITGVGVVDRPMVDHTGIKGTVDYTLEWGKVAANVGFGATFEPDESAPTFEEALKKQLGIKMVSQKGPVETFIVDHVEHPSSN
jgi:uncharacterized protein (TIGR03435 family)